MTKSQINKFRTALETIVTQLDSPMRRRDDILVEGAADALDRTLRASERELAVRSLEADSKRLRQAHDALDRIQGGCFGVCQDCEEEISLMRLTAVPWAALCIRCQQKADSDFGRRQFRHSLPMAA